MSNNYYYSAPLNDNGEAGLGLILLFIFGVINSLISQWFGSWSNFFLVVGCSLAITAFIGLINRFCKAKYLKAQKKYEAEQAKKPKEREEPTGGNWWEEPDDGYNE